VYSFVTTLPRFKSMFKNLKLRRRKYLSNRQFDSNTDEQKEAVIMIFKLEIVKHGLVLGKVSFLSLSSWTVFPNSDNDACAHY